MLSWCKSPIGVTTKPPRPSAPMAAGQRLPSDGSGGGAPVALILVPARAAVGTAVAPSLPNDPSTQIKKRSNQDAAEGQ